ncbi:Phospholipase A2-beta [Striga hermonthica]|uniref:Phospholipase A2-beta n=1 Tax=Striga hermonthica TaxID=68872 RepID=A0A9N7NF41_STRHE|nr:Phospholipase A2-beta [Striga hermonthica]
MLPKHNVVQIHRAAVFILIILSVSGFIESSVEPQFICSRKCVAEDCSALGMKYGKYCGLGWSGCPGEKPCDDLDACCQAHDECVEKYGVTNIECHEKCKKCVIKVGNSGKVGFSESCPYSAAVPTLIQCMEASPSRARGAHRLEVFFYPKFWSSPFLIPTRWGSSHFYRILRCGGPLACSCGLDFWVRTFGASAWVISGCGTLGGRLVGGWKGFRHLAHCREAGVVDLGSFCRSGSLVLGQLHMLSGVIRSVEGGLIQVKSGFRVTFYIGVRQQFQKLTPRFRILLGLIVALLVSIRFICWGRVF